MKLEKRKYQQEALEELAYRRKIGGDKGLLVLATGLGKTVLAVQDVLAFEKETGRTPKVLFTAHINDILEEGLLEFNRRAPHVELTIETLQGLYQNLHNYTSDKFDYIIYDEAHHGQAKTFKQVIKHFEPGFTLGLTATPNRADGKSLKELFGETVYQMGLPQALAQGWLADVDYQLVFDDAIKGAIEKGFNPTSIKQVRELLEVKPRNEQIVDSIIKEKKRLKLRHAQTIVFCQSIEHAEAMSKLLKGKAYHSDLPKFKKDRIYQDFKSGKLEVICTCDMFNEGIDIPNARLIVFLRSTASRTIFLQQLGRGLRKTDSKRKVSVLDFAANIERLEYVFALGSELEKLQVQRGEIETVKQAFNFQHGKFVFSKEVLNIIERINTFYEEIPTGSLVLADLAKRHRSTVRTLRSLADKENMKIKIGRTKYFFHSAYYIDAEDWQKLYNKYRDGFNAKPYDKDEPYYTIKEIMKKTKSGRRTIQNRLKETGWKLKKRSRGHKVIPIVSYQQYDDLLNLYPDLSRDNFNHEEWISFSELARKLNIPSKSLSIKAKNKDVEVRTFSSGGRRHSYIRKADEKKFITTSVPNVVPEGYVSMQDLAKELITTESTLRSYRKKLGLISEVYYTNNRRRKYLSKDQAERLKEAYKQVNPDYLDKEQTVFGNPKPLPSNCITLHSIAREVKVSRTTVTKYVTLLNIESFQYVDNRHLVHAILKKDVPKLKYAIEKRGEYQKLQKYISCVDLEKELGISKTTIFKTAAKSKNVEHKIFVNPATGSRTKYIKKSDVKKLKFSRPEEQKKVENYAG